MIIASKFGNVDVVKLLLQQPKMNVNIQDKFNNSALIEASIEDDVEIVKLLLQQPNININLKDNLGYIA